MIDDDPFSRELVSRILMDAGASVESVVSAGKALAALDEDRPDLIISDIGMPGDDGYRFVQQLRRTGDWRARLPCIALTAFARKEDRARAMSVGFDEHLGKPFDPASLCATISRLAPKRSTGANRVGETAPAMPCCPPSGNTPHVLLAEDSPHISEMIKSALEHHGYRVSVAQSIAEALVLARESPVDILLSDLRLKDGMGWDLLAKLREGRAIPGIAMSGYADQAYISKSQSAGFAEYMVKPVDPDELVNAIRRLTEASVVAH
jgi:CheY-like chemotaxis protein